MPNVLEIEFHEAMLNIYRRAKAEAKYNATLFLQMVVDHGGLHPIVAKNRAYVVTQAQAFSVARA